MITNFSTPSEIALELLLWVLTAWALRECWVYAHQLYHMWRCGLFNGQALAPQPSTTDPKPPPSPKGGVRDDSDR